MRPFGFELELLGCSWNEFPDGISIQGQYFACIADSSIPNGTEIISPILNSLEIIPSLCFHLKKLGFYSGQRCGMHVHVGINWKSMVSVLDLQNVAQKVWDETDRTGFPSTKERKNSYCRDEIVGGGKYRAINTDTKYDTLELRIFNSCLSARFICRAILFSLKVVENIEKELDVQYFVQSSGNPVGVG